MWLRTFQLWVIMAAAMTANGVFRYLVLQPALGARGAELVSVAMAVALVLLIARSFIRSLDPEPRTSAAVAAGWLGLTVAFEFAFGHWVAGASWAALLASYNVADGRLWPVVLVAIGSAPFLWRRRHRRALATHAA